MKVVIQRVSDASVTVDNRVRRQISKGIVILLGIEEADSEEDVKWLVGKISRLRIFDDEKGIMNLSIVDINGEILIISQFTLHASTKKGNRPSYIKAARPEKAVVLYKSFIDGLKDMTNCKVLTGEFGAIMDVSLTNNGPVTIIIDSKKRE